MKRMKPLLISIFIAINLSLSVFSEEQESLLDINEILTEEDILWDQEIQEYAEGYNAENYYFTTDRAFEELKQAMLQSLGGDWVERLDKPDGKERKKAVLVSPSFRGTQIWLTHSERNFFGKKFSANISITDLLVIDIERPK